MNTLRKARQELKQTQVETAEGIGISYSMYTKMESGNKKPSIDTMRKTASYFGKMGLCQPVLMKLYLESNSFTNWVFFFDFDFEFDK